MRKPLTLLILLLAAPLAWAQIGGGGTNVGGGALVRLFPGIPSGVCTAGQLAQNNATGDLYTCLAGSWHEVGGGGGGGGTVTNTGDLTAGHLLIANGGVDITADPVWTNDGAGNLAATPDGSVTVGPDSGQQASIFHNGATAGFTTFDNDSGNTVSADPTHGLALDGPPLNLQGPNVGPADIIDSTGSHGTITATGFQFLASLGTGAGVLWIKSPTVAYTNTAVSQVAAITDTTMVTVGGTSTSYRFSGTVNCDTTSAAATATLNLKWTDTASQAHTLSSVAACTALGSASFANQVNFIRAKTGTTITWGVTIANTPTFDVDVRLELL